MREKVREDLSPARGDAMVAKAGYRAAKNQE
jgi:hypothetical protein